MGRTEIPDLKRFRGEPTVGKAKPSNGSEMELFHECTLQCAQKELDTTYIVREAILHQAQGEPFIARLTALIFLLQIARAQD